MELLRGTGAAEVRQRELWDCRSDYGTVPLFEPGAIRRQDAASGWFADAGSRVWR